MKDPKRKIPAGAGEECSAETYTQYKKDRYQAFILRRNSLIDQAFKTSERYDQWVLTLSGGALAVSLTFLEKIAPHPTPKTLICLGLAWLAFIVSLLSGFYAIYFSREALYREREIWDAVYDHFTRTATEEKPEGRPYTEDSNPASARVTRLSRTSTASLMIGTLLLCGFALANIPTASPKERHSASAQTNALQPSSYTVSSAPVPQTDTTTRPAPVPTNAPSNKQAP